MSAKLICQSTYTLFTQALYVHPIAERDVESAKHLGGFLKRKA